MNFKARKRLYRSRKDRQIAGVCGGVGDYLGIDPTIVRLLWVILSIAGGPGLLLYLIMAAVVPEEPEHIQASAAKSKGGEAV